jgi:hypothetical protein
MESPFVRFLGTALVAATAFWLPNLVTFALWPRTNAGAPYWYDYGVPLISVACPAALALFMVVIRQKTRIGRHPLVNIAALVGVWLVAPYFALLAAITRSTRGIWQVASLSIAHPIAAWELVVVQGGIYALIIATLMLLGIYLHQRRMKGANW